MLTAQFLFVAVQNILLILPLVVLSELQRDQKINWFPYDTLSSDVKTTLAIVIMSTLGFANYYYYFREKAVKRLLVRYTYKYPFIEENPGAAYFLFHILFPVLLVGIAIVFTKLI